MEFSNRTRTGLLALMRWRRDVRHFRDDPVPEALQDHLQKAMALAPSVGNARPWRVFRVESPDARQQVHAIFARANAAAIDTQPPERQAAYRALKLEGLQAAPCSWRYSPKRIRLPVMVWAATACRRRWNRVRPWPSRI